MTSKDKNLAPVPPALYNLTGKLHPGCTYCAPDVLSMMFNQVASAKMTSAYFTAFVLHHLDAKGDLVKAKDIDYQRSIKPSIIQAALVDKGIPSELIAPSIPWKIAEITRILVLAQTLATGYISFLYAQLSPVWGEAETVAMMLDEAYCTKRFEEKGNETSEIGGVLETYHAKSVVDYVFCVYDYLLRERLGKSVKERKIKPFHFSSPPMLQDFPAPCSADLALFLHIVNDDIIRLRTAPVVTQGRIGGSN